MSSHGEMGIFPALLEPARALAEDLPTGEHREIDRYPGHFVAHAGDLPETATLITEFEVNGELFALFERSGNAA